MVSNQGIDARIVAPGDLVIAANVRADTKVDKSFITNIKQHGVLVPVLVEEHGDELHVVDGQRRTIAAVEAGLSEIPVVVKHALAADSDRIVQQLVVNDQRRQLTDVEHASAYHQLALFGVTADQIARRTNSPRKKVDAALAVASSPFATELASTKPVTLEHAAAISEFEHHPEIAERLATVAIERPNVFEHELAEARGRRDRENARQALVEQLNAAGIQILERQPSWRDVATICPADELYTDEAGDHPLTEEASIRPEGIQPTALAAWVTTDWINPDPEPDLDGLDDDAAAAAERAYEDGYRYVPIAIYFVSGWQELGYKYLGSLPSQATPTQTADVEKSDEQAAAEKAARRLVLANNKAWPIATEIRRAWISEQLLSNNILPEWAGWLIALWLGSNLPKDGYSVSLTRPLGWLGITDQQRWQPDVVREHLEKHPLDGLRLALAIVLSSCEQQLEQKDSWRDGYGRDSKKTAAYLQALATWGYGLSNVEQSVIDTAAKKTTTR